MTKKASRVAVIPLRKAYFDIICICGVQSLLNICPIKHPCCILCHFLCRLRRFSNLTTANTVAVKKTCLESAIAGSAKRSTSLKTGGQVTFCPAILKRGVTIQSSFGHGRNSTRRTVNCFALISLPPSAVQVCARCMMANRGCCQWSVRVRLAFTAQECSVKPARRIILHWLDYW